ncbi:MAG: hypothetical protein COW71_07100 [Ignavibacteriales bacterium CG18_big_fil_WC_8_21_14_2_50_31_20]|nr:MAG: hypothetical protein COW71_07100 [Ignavibacteriales bacterium CG18_big_fil_WC_8_21_14_2_50_31_20]
MQNNFTPSINIERDFLNKIEYFSTPNTELIFNSIERNIQKGVHSFELIGSFGTGKSSFLLAFQKQLENKEIFFNSELNIFCNNQYKTISITGYYEAIGNLINSNLKEPISNDFITSIEKRYKKNRIENFHTIILIDEFGKILEYSAKTNPEKELSDIQRLAEFVNDHSKDIMLITTLHQAFDSYSNGLANIQKDEWSKVKGRFHHVLFNEPVEQLLLLAAKKINNGKKEIPRERDLLQCIRDSGAYQLKLINFEIARKLYPHDILSIATLTLALQKYGQNERSLFTFLNTNTSQINNDKKPYINLIDVYDYLVSSFYYYLTSKYNSDFINWQSVSTALQRVHENFDEEIEIFEGIIKTIGILSIFSKAGAKINNSFLTHYLSITHEYKNIDSYLKKLEKHKIIRFQNFRDSYVLFEGTDLDLDFLVKSAEHKITISQNLSSYVEKYFGIPPVLASEHFYSTGTPRYFNYIITEKPLTDKADARFDGSINIVVNEKIRANKIVLSSSLNDQIIFIHIKDKNLVIEHIREIEKVNFVISNEIGEDSVARKELLKLKEFHIKELNQFLVQSLFTQNKNITWIYNGAEIKVTSKTEFNRMISNVCNAIYFNAPIYKNELINRMSLSGSINKAKRDLLTQLINNWNKPNLGFLKDKFPPEKTIYLTLLKSTGIHKGKDSNFYFDTPTEPSFQPLWGKMDNFLFESKATRKSILSLIELLSEKPFGLKNGFIDVWLTVWIFIKRNDFALFYGEKFVSEISTETIDLILKKPSDYFLKSFDLGGIKLDFFNKYRKLINAHEGGIGDKVNFIETIKPFLILHKSLTYYSKQTLRLNQKTIDLRDAITNAKDPENIFFVEFPSALGYTTNLFNENTKIIEKYFAKLKNCINELQLSYPALLSRIEEAIIKEFDFSDIVFPEYKVLIQNRYKSIRKFSLLPKQKIILQRINSELDEREAWITSFAQGLIGKQPEKFEDEDEEIFYDTLSKTKKEFDNLSDFTNLDIDIQKEDAVKVEITSIRDGLRSEIIRVPKILHNSDNLFVDNFKNIKDKNERISLLLTLLKDELDD